MRKRHEKIKSRHIKFLKTIAEGLTAFITFESRCGMSAAYSEYLMYSPFVRICADKNWKIRPEEMVSKKYSDRRRIDYHIVRNDYHLFVELKWIPNKKKNHYINLDIDMDRLKSKKFNKKTELYIFIIGNVKGSSIQKTFDEYKNNFEGEYNTFYKTSQSDYGVSVFKITKKKFTK